MSQLKAEMGNLTVSTDTGLPIVIQKDAKITRLMEKPPIQAGTNRYRNMEIVMDCKNVPEAMDRLRNVTPKGSKKDIYLAIRAGAIKLG